MSAGGKGSTPRPFAVSYREFSDNWDRVFNKPKYDPLQPNDWQDVLSTYDCFDIEDTTDVEKQQER